MSDVSTDSDPYSRWLGIPAYKRPPSYYDLLGVDEEETNRTVIKQAAARRRAKLKTKLGGPHADVAREAMYLIGEAAVVLTDPASRRAYDRDLPLLEEQWDRRRRRLEFVEDVRPDALADGAAVGEGSGVLGLFLGLFALLGLGLGTAFWLNQREGGPVTLRAPEEVAADRGFRFGAAAEAGPLADASENESLAEEEFAATDAGFAPRGAEEESFNAEGGFAEEGAEGGLSEGGLSESGFVANAMSGAAPTEPEIILDTRGSFTDAQLGRPSATEEIHGVTVSAVQGRTLGRHDAPHAGHVGVSPDGTRVFTGGQDGAVRAWSRDDGTQTWSYVFENDQVAGVHPAPDGDSVWALAKQAGRAVQLSAASGAVLTEFETGDVDGLHMAQNSALHRDGDALTLHGEDGSVQIFAIPSGERLVREEGVSPPSLVAGNATDALFFGGSEGGREAGTILAATLRRNWQTRRTPGLQGRVDTAALQGLQGRTVALALAPDDARLAAASGPGGGREAKVALWALGPQGGTLEREIVLPDGWAWALAFSPDGRTLATGGGGGGGAGGSWFGGSGGYLWDVATGAPIARLTAPDGLLSLAFAPDGREVFAATADGRVVAWTVPEAALGAPAGEPAGNPFTPPDDEA